MLSWKPFRNIEGVDFGAVWSQEAGKAVSSLV